MEEKIVSDIRDYESDFLKIHKVFRQKGKRQNMKRKIIYRKPCGKQDRFMLSTTYIRTKNVRRSLELCKDLYLNMVNFNKVGAKDAKACVVACEEIAIDGSFKDTELINKYDYAVEKKAVTNAARYKTVSTKDVTPEQLRMKIYSAILQGAVGVEYNSVFGEGITKDAAQGPLFRFMQDMNYRISQVGRTLIALKSVGVYCSADVIENYPDFAKVAKPISESAVLAEQELPAGVAIGEFKDAEGNLYLMYQNCDCSGKKAKGYSFELKREFRVYRVNSHDGKQILSKESANAQKIMIMPGDADLLRYQNTEEEACLVEYVIKR